MAPTQAAIGDFDLDITVVEHAPAAETPIASDGGCTATCASGVCVSTAG